MSNNFENGTPRITTLETAATATWSTHVANYDMINSGRLRQLVAAGAPIRLFSKEVLDASYVTTLQIFDELRAMSPDFAKIYPHLLKASEEYEI